MVRGLSDCLSGHWYSALHIGQDKGSIMARVRLDLHDGEHRTWSMAGFLALKSLPKRRRKSLHLPYLLDGRRSCDGPNILHAPYSLLNEHILYTGPILRRDFILNLVLRQPLKVLNSHPVSLYISLPSHDSTLHEERLLACHYN